MLVFKKQLCHNRGGRANERQLHVFGTQLVRLRGSHLPSGVRRAAGCAHAGSRARRSYICSPRLAHYAPPLRTTTRYAQIALRILAPRGLN